MSVRGVWILGMVLVSPINLHGEDTVNEKLDAILDQLQSLKQRVASLEQRVEQRFEQRAEQLTPAEQRRPVAQPVRRMESTRQMPRVNPNPITPAEVIRLQQESPALLLKGIRSRERQLRKRFFPAELIPYRP